MSLFYLIGLFGMWDGLWTLSVSAAGTYCIAKYLRHSPYMPWVGFAFVMAHMSLSQLRRQFAESPSVVDITGAQMILVIKLSAFCWNVADGTLADDVLSDFQKDRRLKELPSLLDFAGYVFFFPSLMVGPAFDFAEYKRWIDTTMFDLPAGMDPSKKPPSRKKRRIPRSGTPAAWKAAAGTFWMGLFVFLGRFFYPELLLSDLFVEMSFLRRIIVLHMVGFTARLKYYAVWTLTEGACILAGLGYRGVNPITGNVSWDRLQNINPLLVEKAQNSRAYLEGWNINTNNWLRNYVYLRVTPRGKRPGFRASLATFASSALWHGFYPGYYLTFFLASLIQTVAKKVRRYVRPFFLDSVTGKPTAMKIYYDIASWAVTQLIFSFATAPFLILSLHGSLLVWGRLYHYGSVITLLALGILASPATHASQAWLEERRRRIGVDTLDTSHYHESVPTREPILGLSVDPETDIHEAVAVIRAELIRKTSA
jgi:lysophospholipid acyltransferase